MLFFELLDKSIPLVSIFILGFGLFFSLKGKTFSTYLLFGIYFFILFMVELFSKKIGVLLGNNNLILFSFSCLIHFIFLTLIYAKYFFNIKRKHTLAIILIGSIPLFVFNTNWIPDSIKFESYDRALYSLIFVIYSLTYFYQTIKTTPLRNYGLILNASVLIFFSLDVFLAVGTNYLINENLTLVSWFWTIRALFLQLFYVSLIHFIWKDGKIQQHQ